jgi:hypothetical protein
VVDRNVLNRPAKPAPPLEPFSVDTGLLAGRATTGIIGFLGFASNRHHA